MGDSEGGTRHGTCVVASRESEGRAVRGSVELAARTSACVRGHGGGSGWEAVGGGQECGLGGAAGVWTDGPMGAVWAGLGRAIGAGVPPRAPYGRAL